MDPPDPLAQALAFFRSQFADTKPQGSAYLAPVITVQVNGKEHAFKAEAIAAQVGAVRVSANRYLLPAEKRTLEELVPPPVKKRRPPGPNSQTSSWPKYRKEPKKRLLKPGVSPRTVMITKEYLTGKHKNATRAAQALGLIENGKCLHHTELRAVRRLATEILDKAGITDDKLGAKFAELIDATTTKFFAFQGKVLDEKTIADNETQRFVMDKAAVVRGFYPKETEQASEGPAKMEIVFQQVQGAEGQAQGMTVRIGGKGDE